MLAKFVVTVAALCVFQSASALMVRRDAAPAENVGLQQLGEQAKQLAEQFGAQVKNAINDDTWKQNWHNNTDGLLKTLQEWTKASSSQLSTVGENIKDTVSDAVAKMNQTVAELRSSHPELENKSKEVSENIQNGLKTFLTEADKIAKSVASNTEGVRGDLEKATKEGYEKFIQNLKDINEKVNAAANKA